MTSTSKPRVRRPGPPAGRLLKVKAEPATAVQHETEAREFGIGRARFEAVMQVAERSGLLRGKSGRIGGRVSPALVRQAKRQTGFETDTDLIEFALATVALDDNFAETFKDARGKIDRQLKLGF
jgi:hypothetical protein